MTSDRDGYAVITDENFVNTVKRVDLATQSVSQGLDGLSGGFVPGLGVFGDAAVYILDQGSFGDPASAGVKVYDVHSDMSFWPVRSARACRRRALRSSAVWLISMGIALWTSAISWHSPPRSAGTAGDDDFDRQIRPERKRGGRFSGFPDLCIGIRALMRSWKPAPHRHRRPTP